MKIYRPLQWRVQTFRKGGGVIKTGIEGEAGQKQFWGGRFGPQFDPKIRRGRALWAPSLDPPQAPCKVIKDTLGFWIPRSKVDSGFQENWIPNYLSVALGFQIFIVTVTDSRFPSVKRGFQSLWFRDTAQAEVIGFLFFFSKDYLSCALLYHFVFLCVSFFVLSVFFWMRELMPDNYSYIFHPYPLVPSPSLKRYQS